MASLSLELLQHVVQPLDALILLVDGLSHCLLVFHELLLVLAAGLLEPRCVLRLDLGDLVRGLADAVQGFAQLSVLGLGALQELQEGLDLSALPARATPHLLL